MIGQNVWMAEGADGFVTVTFDLLGDLGPSTSGKTRRVASTGGNIVCLGGLRMGINAYDPAKREITLADVPDVPRHVIGSNLEGEVKNGLFLIRFDSGADLGVSKSGKSRLVATSRGNTTVAGGIKLGVNIYDPVPVPRS